MPKKPPEIVQNGHPVLRKRAKEVPVHAIPTREIGKTLKDMSEALAAQEDGVAIAAPQIGVSLRIFVVSGKVFDREALKDGEDPDRVFVNPVITKMSRKKAELEEGCLSVRWLYGKIKRSEKVSLTAYDETGKKFSYSASGLLAQIFQHETDHLNGILFIDSATDLHEFTPLEREERRTKIKNASHEAPRP